MTFKPLRPSGVDMNQWNEQSLVYNDMLAVTWSMLIDCLIDHGEYTSVKFN